MDDYRTFENGEFSETVKGIVDKLCQRSNRVDSTQIPNMIEGVTGMTEFNCYPGYPSNTCYQTAFFVSFNSKLLAEGKEHLHFRKIIKRLNEHMLKCGGITTNVVIITDSWDAGIASNEQNCIDQIKARANVELYFFTVSPVPFVTRVPI